MDWKVYFGGILSVFSLRLVPLRLFCWSDDVDITEVGGGYAECRGRRFRSLADDCLRLYI